MTVRMCQYAGDRTASVRARILEEAPVTGAMLTAPAVGEGLTAFSVVFKGRSLAFAYSDMRGRCGGRAGPQAYWKPPTNQPPSPCRPLSGVPRPAHVLALQRCRLTGVAAGGLDSVALVSLSIICRSTVLSSEQAGSK